MGMLRQEICPGCGRRTTIRHIQSEPDRALARRKVKEALVRVLATGHSPARWGLFQRLEGQLHHEADLP